MGANGFKKPVDKITNAKCTGITKEKDSNKFRINWTYSFPDKVKKTRDKYPETWGGSYGQWSTMYSGYHPSKGNFFEPPREDYITTKYWKKAWDDKKENTPAINRADWYPYKDAKGKFKPRLKKLSMAIYGHNDAGSGPGVVLPFFEFSPPPAPKMNAISYNNENGNISTKLTFKRALCTKADTCEVVYRRIVTQEGIVYDKAKKEYIKKVDTSDWVTSTTEEITLSYAPSWAKRLTSGQRVTVEWQAFTRGIVGPSSDKYDSKKKKWIRDNYVSRKYVYAWPGKGVITRDGIRYDSERHMIKFPLKTNHNAATAPVDKVTMQYNNSTTISKVADLADISWSNIDNMEDNGNCDGFVVPTQEIQPAVGNRLWVRLKTEHGSYTRYSEPVRVDQLYVAEPTAAGDKCEILSSSSVQADGKGVALKIGFNGNDGDTGTEVSWSTYSGAWDSNEEPSTYNITRGGTNNPDPATAAQWPKIHTLYLRGLEEGQLYYVRARRYLEGENGTTYSSYSKREFLPVSQPDSVWLTLPEAVPYGDDLPVSWGYDSEAEQKDYYIYDPSKPKIIWASGKDANGYVVIPWDKLKSKVNYPEEETLQSLDELVRDDILGLVAETGDNDEVVFVSKSIDTEQVSDQGVDVTLRVKMSTGGPYQISDPVTTHITRPPKASIEIPLDGTFFKRLGSGKIGMVSQGGLVYVYSTAKTGYAVLTIESDAVVRGYPDNSSVVYRDGTVIWSDEFSDETLVDLSEEVILYLEGEEVDGEGGLSRLTCQLPSDLDFVDGVNYRLLVSVTDLETGLTSDVAEVPFVVEWAHKPVAADTTLSASEEDMSVTIGVWKPEGASDSDVVDIYRATPDGYYLIASGISWGSLVTDRFAPYANGWGETLYYRVSTRTADGAEYWSDTDEYSLYGYSLRFDWGVGETLELPYNLSISDVWAKGFEARKHMDGSYGGYFDGSVMRTANISTDMIKVSQDADKKRIRDLAGYSGPVFVRTPMGNAYTANVVPNNMTYEFNNPIVSVSFEITEFKLADQFKVLSDDIVETGYSTYEEYLESQ